MILLCFTKSMKPIQAYYIIDRLQGLNLGRPFEVIPFSISVNKLALYKTLNQALYLLSHEYSYVVNVY